VKLQTTKLYTGYGVLECIGERVLLSKQTLCNFSETKHIIIENILGTACTATDIHGHKSFHFLSHIACKALCLRVLVYSKLWGMKLVLPYGHEDKNIVST
jgi:hypothetical protein